VTEVADAPAELFGCQVPAAFVKQEQGRIAAMEIEGRCFLAPPLVGAARAALRDLAYTGEVEADRWTGLAKPPEISLGEFPLGAGFHPAHGVNAQAHVCLP